MKILSVRKGFLADHSSTSYEFLAIDRPLNEEQRREVALLSRRARPDGRRVSFVYNGEFSDLPGGPEPLLGTYYDVMYSESYDTWTLAMAFKADRETREKLRRHGAQTCEGHGVEITCRRSRVIIMIYCRFDSEVLYGLTRGQAGKSDDLLLNLLTANRACLMKGDYRLLYGVREIYGCDDDGEEEMPAPEGMDELPEVVSDLLSLMTEE